MAHNQHFVYFLMFSSCIMIWIIKKADTKHVLLNLGNGDPK